MTLEYKEFGLSEFKAIDEKGKGQAVIATLNSVDRDNDVTHPGAFGEQRVKILQAHNWTEPSIGDARLYESGNQVIADFELNLEMEKAQEVYKSLKWDLARHRLQEWSYGFKVEDHDFTMHEGKRLRVLKRVKAYEISPVVVGAGIGTGTLALKSAEPPMSASPDPQTLLISKHVTEPQVLTLHNAISPHGGPVDNRVWDAFVHQGRVKSDGTRAYYNALYAICDGDKGTTRAEYRGLHHIVEADGTPGPASVQACLQILVYLHKGLYAAEEREGIYTHIAAHLKDAGIAPLQLGRADNYSLPLDERIQVYMAEVDGVIEELIGIHDIRQGKGLSLPEKRIQNVRDIRERIDALAQMLHLKGLGRYSAAVEEEQRRQHLREFHERIESVTREQEATQTAANTARATGLQQRLIALEKRVRSPA